MPEDDISGGRGGAGASYGLQSDVKMQLPGLEEATKQITAMTSALGDLSESLKGMANNQSQLTSGMNAITSSADRMGSSAAFLAPRNYDPSQMAGGMGTADVSWLGGIGKQIASGDRLGAVGSAVTAPLTYAFNRVEQNRMVTRLLSHDLGRVSTMSGTGIEGILQMLGRGTPVLGAPEEITAAMSQGATQGFANMNSPRSGAYYTGLRQMQQFTPGIAAPELAQMSSRNLGNTRAQQTAMMLTGGAMSSFGPGAVPKTLQEWAEGLLRWFEGQRPGADRGKAFTKEELATQFFPGSNISAWMTTTGVPDYMQDYFWQYAMGKVQATGTTGGAVTMETIMAQRGGDLALANKVTQTAGARRDFTMAATPALLGDQSFYKAYMTREDADQWFTDIMTKTVDQLIAKILGSFSAIIAKIPTPVAAFFQSAIAEAGPAAGQIAEGFKSLLPGGGQMPGDPEYHIGDAGAYGPLGGTGTAGMTPDMAKRINAMRRANPNVQITSGFRDGALQSKLHKAGVGMTAPGGHSMHGRGLAADLGPSSQYGWIAANAGRFGLASGKKHGEPWHVGMPGTMPGKNFMIGDISDLFGNIGSAMNPANWWEGIQGIGSSVFDTISSGVSDLWGTIKNFGVNLFQGGVSALKGDFSALYGEGAPFNPVDLMSQSMGGLFNLMGMPSILNPLALLSGAAGKGASAKDFGAAFASMLGSGAATGGLMKPVLKSSMDWSSTGAAAGGATGGGSAAGPSGAAMPASVAAILQKYNGGQTGVNPGSISNPEGVKTALSAAQRAGFSGDALIAIASIAGRESTWNPAAHRSTQDKSQVSGDRGMWQINYTHDKGLASAGIIPSNDPSGRKALFDPNVNAQAAFWLSKSGSDFGAWNYGPGGWGTGPPLYKAAQYVQPVYDLAKQWGFVGDPGYAPAYAPFPSPGGTNVVVQNSITVAGGGNSSIGLRRTAEQLAGFTTDEIRKQMARTT